MPPGKCRPAFHPIPATPVPSIHCNTLLCGCGSTPIPFGASTDAGLPAPGADGGTPLPGEDGGAVPADGGTPILDGGAPFYDTYAPEIINILNAPQETLVGLDRASWEPSLRHLGIGCEFIYASELPVSGRGPRLLLNICKYLGSSIYLSGAFGREYLDAAMFTTEGVEILFHEYAYPIYPQLFGDFVPFLSYLDMLFNVGLNPADVSAGGRLFSPDGSAVTPKVARAPGIAAL